MRTRRVLPCCRLAITSTAVVALAAGMLEAPSAAAATTPTSLSWTTVVDSAVSAPGSTKHFNSFSQPSVNSAGVVVFRGRTQGPAEPVRGVYLVTTPGSITKVAGVSGAVPQPNNTAAGFTEFPSFPRIDSAGSAVVTRGQSQPVWTYTQADGTDTRTGTSGVYTTVGGALTTAASMLGAVPGFEAVAVPGAPAGTRFDQFPGAPSVAGTIVAFKGNYTDAGGGRTGVFYRDLALPGSAVQLIADSATPIPNQPAGGPVTFGSTAPPSAAGGRIVFTGWDDEDAPTLGGVYLSDAAATPHLRALVGIGDPVPGTSDTFRNFGEGLSFDGRYVGFWASWGAQTRPITLACPTDGNADLLAYCNRLYPNGYATTVPVHQGVFGYDTVTGTLHTVLTTGGQFDDFLYWVFSGRPPGTGSGDEESTLEPARWRSSPFVAVSGTGSGGFQLAVKASPATGGSGIYLARGPADDQRALTVADTTMAGTAVDPQAPAGSLVTAVGLERDGFRGRKLAVTVSMLDAATSASWAGVYLTTVPATIVPPQREQTLTITSTPPDPALVGATYQVTASTESGLPVALSIDPASPPTVCTISGTAVALHGAGTCTVDADQPGDDTWAAAPRVQQSFEISTVPTTVRLTSSAAAAVYGQAVTVTAAVSAASGTATGAVRFTLDGTALGGAVPLVNGHAVSKRLAGPGGAALTPGAHQVGASFAPSDPERYAPAESVLTQTVHQAATAVTVTVHPKTVTAVVRVQSPGTGTPAGTVRFLVGGVQVGSAPLQHGTATLQYVVPSGRTQQVAAEYAGNTDFAGSSDSTSRADPSITATVTSARPRSSYGWYSTPVTVTFRCVTHGSPLIGQCPAAVRLSANRAGQSVLRTVVARDGGAATAVVRDIDIDRVAPAVRVVGVRNGGVYLGPAPEPQCVASDALSGIATCTVTRQTAGDLTTYRATATDRADNSRTITGSYRTIRYLLAGADYADGAFTVHVGRTYLLVAFAAHRPVSYLAVPAPATPTEPGPALLRAGPGRWVLGVTISRAMRTHHYWNLGVAVEGQVQAIRVRVA